MSQITMVCGAIYAIAIGLLVYSQWPTAPETVLALAQDKAKTQNCLMLQPAREEMAEYAEHYVWCAASQNNGTIYAFNAIGEGKRLIDFPHPHEFTGDVPWNR